MKLIFLYTLLLSVQVFSQQNSCYFKMTEGNKYLIDDFHVDFTACHITSDKRNVIRLRNFTSLGKNFSLVVDKNSLKSYVVSSSCLTACGSENENSSRYLTVLATSVIPPYLAENDGLTKDSNANTYLSIDLCPSSKTYDRQFFQDLAEISQKSKFPVALAISGDWILKHTEEFKEILALQRQQKIDITWVNHTRTHPYTIGLPSNHNFLLRADVNPESEILNQEILMLSFGLIPSVFLRYPGLVSNQALIELTRSLGLIPLGSRAWISKTKKFSPGDIILLHGNGNEAHGIRLFYDFAQKNKVLNFSWSSLLSWGIPTAE